MHGLKRQKLGGRLRGAILGLLLAGLGALLLPAGASAAAATHYSVTASSPQTAGTAFDVTVTALDGSNMTDIGYMGTVHFTSTDGQAVLPGDSTLINGTRTFSVTLKTAGSQTITATDAVSSSITGTSGSITVNPAAATHFSLSAPASVTAGSPFSFTVTALDQFNNTDTGYAGIVRFGSSDVAASLPASTALISGAGTFSATLRTAGTQVLTATDTVSAIHGTSSGITVNPAGASHLAVSAPGSVTVGSPFSFIVTALDPFNNTATGYGGTVHFTSSDGAATLPGNSTLTSGVGTFSATLRTEGTKTITATDTISPSITGTTAGIAVSTATHFTVTAPSSATAGSPITFTVTARDASGAVDTGYGGTVRFTSSDDQSSLPLDSQLTNGTGTFTATLRTAGTMTINAIDPNNPSVSGASGPIAVTPSNDFSLGKLKLNKRKGTATLTVDVPGPGKLTLRGKGIRPQRPLTRISSSARTRAVDSAGSVKLTIRARGKAKRKLRRTGRATVKARVAFTPTGGSAARRSIAVKLKKRLHH